MTFASVTAQNNSVQTATATTHNVALPAGITANELLIVLVHIDNTLDQLNAASYTGWTANKLTYGSGYVYVLAKKATGSEGATLSLTSAASVSSTHQSFRIDSSIDPSRVKVAFLTGSQGDPDPPAITMPGQGDHLWIAAGIKPQETPSAIPSGYTALQTNGGNFASSPANMFTAYKQSYSRTENPGVFDTGNFGFPTMGVTIGIPYTAVAPAAKRIKAIAHSEYFATNPGIVLPSNIVAGDRIFIFSGIYMDTGGRAQNPGAGWTTIVDHTFGAYTTGATNNTAIGIYTKIANGTEAGTTVAALTAQYGMSVAVVFNGDPGYTTPQYAATAGNSTTATALAGTTTPSTSMHLVFVAGTDVSGATHEISAPGYDVIGGMTDSYYLSELLLKSVDDTPNTSASVVVTATLTGSMHLTTIQIPVGNTLSGAATLTNGTSSLSATGVISKVGTAALTNGAASLSVSGTVIPGSQALLTNGASALTVTAFRGQFATVSLTNGASSLSVAGILGKVGSVSLISGTPVLAVAGLLNQFAAVALTNGPATLFVSGKRIIVTLWTNVIGSSSIWIDTPDVNAVWTSNVPTATPWSNA